jgi:hypothetical protein
VGVALAAAIFAASALGVTKQAITYIGNASGSGSGGGELNAPRDVGVNSSGAGPADQGDAYVADDNNHRIQRFDKEGNFVSAWGANVVHQDETQSVKVEAAGGTYTLTFEGSTTAPIAYNASSATLDNALDVLPSIGGDANVAVSGSFGAGYVVAFVGTLSGTDVPQMTVEI